MLMSFLDKTKIRWVANMVLVGLCVLMLWMLIDRAFLSQMQTGLGSEPLRPLPNTLRLAWFQSDAAIGVVELTEISEELADASIRAELLGVIIHEDYAFAAIQTPQVPDGLYEVGDEIDNNTELVRIESDRVVVRERGAERQIRLNPLVEGGSLNDGSLIQPVPSDGAGFSLAGVLGATPINVAGFGLGVRLDSVDDEISSMSDLRARDVVLEVGGKPISELMSNPLLWQEFLQQTTVRLSVQREGEALEISVNARSLGERILPKIGQGLVQ
jgi:hypothetical protein